MWWSGNGLLLAVASGRQASEIDVATGIIEAQDHNLVGPYRKRDAEVSAVADNSQSSDRTFADRAPFRKVA